MAAGTIHKSPSAPTHSELELGRISLEFGLTKASAKSADLSSGMVNVGGTRTLIQIASWATPHVRGWRRNRDFHRREAFRNLSCRNWPEAEGHFLAAMGDFRHSAHEMLDLVIGLKESQRKQGRLDDAERTSRSAIDIAVSMKNAGAHARALDALLDIYMDQGRYDEAEHTASLIERLERSRKNPDLGRIVGCTRKLACVLHQSKRKDQATAALEKANRYCQQVYGPKHIETAHSWAELGAIYREMSDHHRLNDACVSR